MLLISTTVFVVAAAVSNRLDTVFLSLSCSRHTWDIDMLTKLLKDVLPDAGTVGWLTQLWPCGYWLSIHCSG